MFWFVLFVVLCLGVFVVFAMIFVVVVVRGVAGKIMTGQPRSQGLFPRSQAREKALGTRLMTGVKSMKKLCPRQCLWLNSFPNLSIEGVFLA